MTPVDGKGHSLFHETQSRQYGVPLYLCRDCAHLDTQHVLEDRIVRLVNGTDRHVDVLCGTARCRYLNPCIPKKENDA